MATSPMEAVKDLYERGERAGYAKGVSDTLASVRALPSPIDSRYDFDKERVTQWHCRWCGSTWANDPVWATIATHPANDCLWFTAHQPITEGARG